MGLGFRVLLWSFAPLCMNSRSSSALEGRTWLRMFLQWNEAQAFEVHEQGPLRCVVSFVRWASRTPFAPLRLLS